VCANAQACAANAIDGDITDLVHTQTASTTQYIWGMWDTGSPLTSIDRVFFSGRNAFGAGYPLWHREINTEVDVTNDSKCSVCLLAYVVYVLYGFSCTVAVTLANGAATPSAFQCNLNLGGQTTQGNMGTGFTAPYSWYGGDCSKFKRICTVPYDTTHVSSFQK